MAPYMMEPKASPKLGWDRGDDEQYTVSNSMGNEALTGREAGNLKRTGADGPKGVRADNAAPYALAQLSRSPRVLRGDQPYGVTLRAHSLAIRNASVKIQIGADAAKWCPCCAHQRACGLLVHCRQ